MKVSKWLLAACLTTLLLPGCDNDPDQKEEVAKLFNEQKLDLVDYKVRKVLSYEDNTNILLLKFGSRKILISCVADMKAGLDFESFDAERDITIGKKAGSVYIVLPAPSITNFKIDVNDVNVEYSATTGLRKGFKEDEKDAIVKQGRAEIEDAIPELGILDDARANAVRRFTSMVEQLGFSDVNITFADEIED